MVSTQTTQNIVPNHHKKMLKCYAETDYCECIGRVSKIGPDGIFFKKLTLEWFYGVKLRRSTDTDVFLMDRNEFNRFNIRNGDVVSFTAEISSYCRPDTDNLDVILRKPESIRIIKKGKYSI